MIDPLIRNEYSKRVYRALGLRKARKLRQPGAHYRLPVLERNGGVLALDPYAGPAIPREEWESLTYTTYKLDPTTFFAPIASADGALELKGFWKLGKPDLEGVWTDNAAQCPTLVAWIESVGARFGRVQLLRMEPNTLREARWGLHLDNNNQLNPETNGWVVRVWLQLTDDPGSALLVRTDEFSAATEQRLPLPRGAQVVLDSERLFHGAVHRGPDTRYALIVSFESGPELDRWIAERLPGEAREGR